MTQEIRDSVSRVRMSFAKTGENLVVDCRVEPGAGSRPTTTHARRSAGRWLRAGLAFASATASG